jgi:uroporphyrinogen decarboxylase
MFNSRLIKALNRQPVDSTPIWIMRQAGRYLPEYRRIREKAGGFLPMCQNPEIASEITLQPLARFNLDAMIIFSDILVIPEAMGLGLHFKENEGPHFSHPIRTHQDVANLPDISPENDLSYVTEAIKLTIQQESRVPLIGFCGSPWTVATYMVEGKSSKTFSLIKKMAYNDPSLLKQLLEKVTQASIGYLKAQIKAGASVAMIFDTWGGVLSPALYETFSLYYMRAIVSALKADPATQNTPVILFTKQGGQHLEAIANSGCQGVGIDWTVDMADAKKRVGNRVALQGNLDPCVLYGSAEAVEQEVKKVLAAFNGEAGHIFNLGHGIYPDIEPEKVQVLIETVRNFR